MFFQPHASTPPYLRNALNACQSSVTAQERQQLRSIRPEKSRPMSCIPSYIFSNTKDSPSQPSGCTWAAMSHWLTRECWGHVAGETLVIRRDVFVGHHLIKTTNPHQKKSNCTTTKTSCITKKRHWHKQNKQLHKNKSSGSWWSSHSRAECGRPGPLAATRLEIIRAYSLGRGSMGSVQEPTPRQVQQLEFNKHLTVALKIGIEQRFALWLFNIAMENRP